MTFPASSPPSFNTFPKGKGWERLSISVPLVVWGEWYSALIQYAVSLRSSQASVSVASAISRRFRRLFGGKTQLNVISSLPLSGEPPIRTWVLISGSKGGLH